MIRTFVLSSTAALLVACGGSSKKPAQQPAPAPTGEAAPNSPKADTDSDDKSSNVNADPCEGGEATPTEK